MTHTVGGIFQSFDEVELYEVEEEYQPLASIELRWPDSGNPMLDALEMLHLEGLVGRHDLNFVYQQQD